MKTGLALIVALFAFGALTTNAGAEAKVVVTREANKLATVEIKAGEEVYWLNQTGGTADVMFGKDTGTIVVK